MHLTLTLVLLTLLVGTVPAKAAPLPDSVPVDVVISLPKILGVDLGDALKVGGILLVVQEYGPEINRAINQLLDNNDAETNASTKVVIILSPDGGYVGAAQVTGPTAAVAKVKAVVQLEKDFRKGIRIRAMVPVSNENPTNIKRVQGVAVSAVIDIKI